MKTKTYLLNTVLIVLTALTLLSFVLIRSFILPAAMLPKANIPNLALLSLTALVAEHYIHPGSKRCYVCIPVFSALTFALLPLASGYAAAVEVWKIALGGCVVFTACTWLFTAMVDRLSSGPAAKAAPLICAAGLYFALQILSGMLL